MIQANVGDKVMIVSFVERHGNRRIIKVLTVKNKTKTQVTCSDGERYMICSGYMVGTGEDRRRGYYGYDARIQDHDSEVEKKIKLEMAFYKKKDELEKLIEKLSAANRKLVHNADKPVFIGLAIECAEMALEHIAEEKEEEDKE